MSASRHVTSHPTEKPEKLLQRILLIGSKEGDMVPAFLVHSREVIEKILAHFEGPVK